MPGCAGASVLGNRNQLPGGLTLRGYSNICLGILSEMDHLEGLSELRFGGLFMHGTMTDAIFGGPLHCRVVFIDAVLVAEGLVP